MQRCSLGARQEIASCCLMLAVSLLLGFTQVACVPKLTIAEATKFARGHVGDRWYMTMRIGVLDCPRGCRGCFQTGVQYPPLEKLGWVKTTCIDGKKLKVTLTKAGNAALPELLRQADPERWEGPDANLHLATEELVAVTGIEYEDKFAYVAYTSKYRPTPTGERLVRELERWLKSPRRWLYWGEDGWKTTRGSYSSQVDQPETKSFKLFYDSDKGWIGWSDSTGGSSIR